MGDLIAAVSDERGCHATVTDHRTFSDPKVGLVPSLPWRALLRSKMQRNYNAT